MAIAIAGKIGVEAALITGLVTALLMIPLKIGKNAWCDKNSGACDKQEEQRNDKPEIKKRTMKDFERDMERNIAK